ncbi:MAG: hypothetical protein LC792_20665 [Actinobacteria bacterium]|nr:hypothetical protein [Actinomycetota bacterium]
MRTPDLHRLVDAIASGRRRDARELARLGITGVGRWTLSGPDGTRRGLLVVGAFDNLITDVGDQYYASRGASVAVNVPTGMRLGTGTTAVAKNGAGAAIVTYAAGSNRALDGGYPTAASKGAGLGWRVNWQSTWAAGVATANGLAEAVISNETPLTDVAGTAANTISRALLSPTVNKGSLDSLVITWGHDLTGA